MGNAMTSNEDRILIGQQVLFTYPLEFETLPEYRSHSGMVGTVERQLTEEEADQGEDLERLFKVRFADGFVGDMFESELTPIIHNQSAEPQQR